MRNPKVLLSCLTGILLSLIFPRAGWAPLAWVSLIPLYLVLKQCQRPLEAARFAFLSGSVFFLLSLHWLIHVIFFGWIIVAFFEASFWLLLGWSAWYFFRIRSAFVRALFFAAAWMTIELLRSEVPVLSLGWNLLGYSQSDLTAVNQAASVIGAYGLGFLMAWANAALAEGFCAASGFAGAKRSAVRAAAAIVLAFLIAGGVTGWGAQRLKNPALPEGTLRIALIQGNIPQSVKWEAMARDQIMEIYFKLTELASYESPELIIWPEASFPGYLNRDPDGQLVMDWIDQLDIPALVGAPHFENYETIYNSAYLITGEGAVQNRYDKINLVPFGEYVPFGRLLDVLKPLAETLGVSDFAAGRERTVFQLREGLHFSVLICFEDTFQKLVREFAGPQTDFLAVMTNDAWFGHTGAPFQHLQASVFRAVENGLPVVRAANTGVSAFIDAYGRVLDTVKGRSGSEIFETGRKTLNLPLQRVQTVYAQGGWLFPYAGAVFFAIMLLICLFTFRQEAAK